MNTLLIEKPIADTSTMRALATSAAANVRCWSVITAGSTLIWKEAGILSVAETW